MPPTIQKDIPPVQSITGAPGSVATTALDENGNIKVVVDNNTYPTYVGLTLSGLTATRLIATDSLKALASVTDLTNWVKGTASRITSTNASGVATLDISAAYVGQASITTLGTIATGTWQGAIIGSAYGGTANGFTKFSGATTAEKTYSLPNASTTILTTASAITVGQGGTGQTSYTDGQLLIGNSTGNTLAKATLTGTSNQIVVTNGSGTITLSTPQNLDTAANAQFATLSLGAAHSTYLFEATGGDIAALTAGKTFRIKEGSNACKGNAVLSGGTILVTNSAAASGDLIVLSPRGISNAGYLGVTIVNGVSFTIDSSNGSDGRTVDWAIIKAS